MTITDIAPAPAAERSEPAADPPAPVPDEAPSISLTRLMLVGMLSAAAAGVVLGGLFQGILGRFVGVVAGMLGAGVVGLGLRANRVMLQYLAAPVVFVAGYLGALVLPNPTGVRGTVPQLVRQAITNGGLGHPPVPFDPGWRFLLVALVGLIGAAAVSLAAGFGRVRLAIVVPMPLVLGGALSQPKGNELVGGGVALALLLVALSVSYSAEIAGSTELSRRFEVRQLITTVVATAIALALLAALSHASVLFPQPAHSQTSQPQKPRIVPLSQIHDRPLFDASGPGPWQVGVLSVYEQGNWLLPPFDDHAVDSLDRTGRVPQAAAGPSVTYQLTVRQLGGFTLPTPAEPMSVAGTSLRIGYDPVRSVLRVRDGAAPEGLHYSVTGRQAPSGDALAQAATAQPPSALRGYLAAPAMPVALDRLLSTLTSKNRWDQLQLLRKQLYDHVQAKGNGVPVPITAAKVLEEMGGGFATPFEIVGAEALLARWVGLPSRIGYGYYDQSKVHGGDFRPADGANWLEVWFNGYGWVPILGTPLKAQSDLNAVKKSEPHIQPSSEQTLQIYVPVLSRDPSLAFEVARFWAIRIVPAVLLLWLAWRGVAVPARALRRRRRRQWAASHGAAGRIAVAYADFRDTSRDLGLDDGRATPLEFLDRVVEDVEHRELAWLTTRALWGDLTRDLRADDAEAAESMSRSLRARLVRAQGWLARLGALGSRASLRDPWDPNLPNAWPRLRVRRFGRSEGTTRRSLTRRFRFALAALVALVGTGCAIQPDLQTRPVASSFPSGVVPGAVDGLTARPEPSAQSAFAAIGANSAVARGEVWTLRQGGLVVGSIQVSQLKGGLSTRSERVRQGIRAAVNNIAFRWFKVLDRQWVGVQTQPQLDIYLWMPPRDDVYVIVQLKSNVQQAEKVVTDLITYEENMK